MRSYSQLYSKHFLNSTQYHLKRLLLLGLAITLCACGGGGGGDDSGSENNSSALTVFNPNNPGTAFQPQRDATLQQDQANRMWNILSSPSCWDSTFVGDPTIGGTPAGVAQFSFFNNDQYRYVGELDTYFGTIFLHDIGTYEDHDTVILETWTGSVEAIVILSDTQFAHVLTNPSGTPFYTSYGPQNDRCL